LLLPGDRIRAGVACLALRVRELRRARATPWISMQACGIPVDKFFLLAPCNGLKTSTGAASSPIVLTTMKAQQAVAKRSVGGHVNTSTCLFFGRDTVLGDFTSRRDPSLRCNGVAVVPSAPALTSLRDASVR
jgi:hypothetical protein